MAGNKKNVIKAKELNGLLNSNFIAWRFFVPLAKNTRDIVLNFALDSGFNKNQAYKAMYYHCNDMRYLNNLMASKHRLDINFNPAEEITEDEINYARECFKVEHKARCKYTSKKKIAEKEEREKKAAVRAEMEANRKAKEERRLKHQLRIEAAKKKKEEKRAIHQANLKAAEEKKAKEGSIKKPAVKIKVIKARRKRA